MVRAISKRHRSPFRLPPACGRHGDRPIEKGSTVISEISVEPGDAGVAAEPGFLSMQRMEPAVDRREHSFTVEWLTAETW